MEICFVCKQMASRRPNKHRNLLLESNSMKTEKCLLCARYFCEAHKSKGCDETVCEIKHATYYAKHSHIPGIFPTLEARERQLEGTEA
ncbi:hypothetical protein BDV12DRAFT_164129 [Aspergillus spectabilis]